MGGIGRMAEFGTHASATTDIFGIVVVGTGSVGHNGKRGGVWFLIIVPRRHGVTKVDFIYLCCVLFLSVGQKKLFCFGSGCTTDLVRLNYSNCESRLATTGLGVGQSEHVLQRT